MEPEAPALLPGDFVWTQFPFHDDPDRPGPIRHVAFVIAMFSRREASQATDAPMGSSGLVVGVYTSSRVQKFEDAVPAGVVMVNSGRASKVGNRRPFFIDTRVRAYLPFNDAFFPFMDQPGARTIGRADAALLKEVVQSYGDINRRRSESIVYLGPLRPR